MRGRRGLAACRSRLRAADDERAAVDALLADPEPRRPAHPARRRRGHGRGAASAPTALARRGGRAATSAADRAADLAALVPALQAAEQARDPAAGRADEVAPARRPRRRAAARTAADDAVLLRAGGPARGGRGRRQRAAAADVAGPLPLVHSDGVSGGARSGLGLLARDAWTGHDRDTATLSGGETFLASLALALGLADVVTAEAGGARIEALFVDEGFGTLDEQTLDEVMDVLDGLRDGGRVVGLVSHVAELRQRIPARLRVHRGRQGSTVSLVGC